MHSMIYLHIQTLSNRFIPSPHFFPFIFYKPLSRKPLNKKQDKGIQPDILAANNVHYQKLTGSRPDSGVPLARMHLLFPLFIISVPFQCPCQTSLFHLLFLAL